MKSYLFLIGPMLILSFVGITGCNSDSKSNEKAADSPVSGIKPQSASPPSDSGHVKTYRVLATVMGVNEKDTTITINNAKIEGFMEEMEIAYKTDFSILKQVRVGTKGHFTLKVVNGQEIITGVHTHKK